MRYNKLKAFTLAEVMILLLTLSILLAAFSPVFTTRFSNYSSDDVWSYVAGDDENDAYYDTTNKAFSAQAFIGLTPAGPAEVSLASADSSGRTLYSKLVIRASDKIKIGGVTQPQNQMQFRYGSSFANPAGSVVGALFAGNNNFLLGGNYQSITNSAMNNTAYGTGALSSLTSGYNNTAVGYNALNALTTGYSNTVVGNNAAIKLTTGFGNTIVGHNAAKNSASIGSYNTIVGNGSVSNSLGNYNTLIGNSIASGGTTTANARYNVAIGNYALNKLTSGYQNTAIGYNSLSNLTSGYSNTAVGINAGMQVTSGSNKTFIGAYSGATVNQDGTAVRAKSGLFTGTEERIFIGGPPKQYKNIVSSSEYPGAVLEVHNVTNKNTSGYTKFPIGNAADASVVVNGNLIIRGATYLEVPIRRPGNQVRHSCSVGNNCTAMETDKTHYITKGLVGFKLLSSSLSGIYTFAGMDGIDRSYRSIGDCNGCRTHLYDDVRQNCICTSVSSSLSDTTYRNNSRNFPLSSSYDWSSKTDQDFGNGCRQRNSFGASYYDYSLKKRITLSDSAGTGSASETYRESDDPMAHRMDGSSCCPVLKSSDRRLKNIGDKFTAGLADLRKLNIYHYTFKDDADKTPYVGVIAQDLKTVFPNAVSKGESGYLQIRWDEMFYALVNAVKEVNTKVTKLASKVTKSQNRITVLKKDNAALNAQLDKLADELTTLEAKKK